MDEDLVGISGVVAGDILSAFFGFFVGVAAVEVNELQIVKTATENILCCFLGQSYFVCNPFDCIWIALVLIHSIQSHDVPQVAVFVFALDGKAESHGADVVVNLFPHDTGFVCDKRDLALGIVGFQCSEDSKNAGFLEIEEVTVHGISLDDAHDSGV